MNLKSVSLSARISLLLRYGIVGIDYNAPFDEPYETLTCKFADGKTLIVEEAFGGLGTSAVVYLLPRNNTCSPVCYWSKFFTSSENPDYHRAIKTFATYSRYLKVLLK